MRPPARDLSKTIIEFLSSHGALHELADIITDLQTHYERHVRKSNSAIVRTATPLNETEQTELMVELKKIFNKELQLELVIDPEVLGGLRIQVGDVVIDRTLQAKLNEVRSILLR